MQQVKMDFAQWTCKFVVMQIVMDELRVPVWGTIIGQTDKTVLFQVDEWCINLEKSVIKGVVEVEGPESRVSELP